MIKKTFLLLTFDAPKVTKALTRLKAIFAQAKHTEKLNYRWRSCETVDILHAHIARAHPSFQLPLLLRAGRLLLSQQVG
jgi:hypothetical protein